MPSNGVGHKLDKTEATGLSEGKRLGTRPRQELLHGTIQLQIRDSRVVQAASVAKRHGALEAQPARE
jgi:hypothetical protein